MFPDILAGTTGSFLGIVLSSELPAAVREDFQDLLSQLTDLRVQVDLHFGDRMDAKRRVLLLNVVGVFLFTCLERFYFLFRGEMCRRGAVKIQ